MQALEFEKHGTLGGIGLTIYPYQISLGFTLRYWPCIFAPAFRLHVGPFKVWGYVKIQIRKGKGNEKTAEV